MKNSIRILLMTGLTLVILNTSCKKDKISAQSDIYVAGLVTVGANTVASYWKNDILVTLGNGAKMSTAQAIFVGDNKDIYVGGRDDSKPCYWKNGTKTLVHPTYAGYVFGITVSNNDVYVVGALDVPQIGYKAFSSKNGQITYLGNATSYAQDIFISGADVYITGSEGGAACYWKNGIKILLTGGVYTRAIYASNNDVYVLGWNDTNNGYWKNGVFNTVNLLNNYSINDFAFDGGQIYIGGSKLSKPIYIVGNTEIPLSVNEGDVYDIDVQNGIVYTAGQAKNPASNIYEACYWKNTEIITLHTATYSEANDIFIVQ